MTSRVTPRELARTRLLIRIGAVDDDTLGDLEALEETPDALLRLAYEYEQVTLSLLSLMKIVGGMDQLEALQRTFMAVDILEQERRDEQDPSDGA